MKTWSACRSANFVVKESGELQKRLEICYLKIPRLFAEIEFIIWCWKTGDWWDERCAIFFVSVSAGLLAMTSAWCGSNDRDEWCNSKGIALACLMNRDSECRRKLAMFSQRSTCVCRALAAKQNSASTFSFRCKITSDMTNDTLFKHRKTHLQISSTFFSAALSRHFRFSHLNRLYFVFSHRIFFSPSPIFHFTYCSGIITEKKNRREFLISPETWEEKKWVKDTTKPNEMISLRKAAWEIIQIMHKMHTASSDNHWL